MTNQLPPKALALINAYSKPVTHPYWRFGTKSALLIKNCPLMRELTDEMLIHIRDQTERVRYKFGEEILKITKDASFSELLQIHGEELFDLSTMESGGIHKPDICTTFYSCMRYYLKSTGHFESWQYMTYETNFRYTLVWVYIKNPKRL